MQQGPGRRLSVSTRLKSKLASLLPKGRFARGVTVLVGGTAGAQALSVIAAPLLTRLYTPEDFGTLAVYAGLLGLLGTISTFSYILAIPLPKHDGEAANIVALCLAILLGVTGVVAFTSVWFADPVAAALGVPMLANYLWLLPVGVLLGGVYSIFSHWAVRTKRFADIATTGLTQAIVTLAIKIAGFKAGALALLLGQTTGQGVGSFRLAKHALANSAFRTITMRAVADAAKRHRHFPLFMSWANIFRQAGLQLPPLMFAALFSAGAAGLFSLAHRMLLLPTSLIGNAVSKVFLSQAPTAHRTGTLGELVDKTHSRLAQISMPPAAAILLAGPGLFSLAFGHEWRAAGEFASWMSPWLYLEFCTAPLPVFIVTGHQHLNVALQFILLVVRVSSVVIGTAANSLQLAIVLFSLGSSVCYGVFLYLKLRIAGADLLFAFRSHLKSLAFTVLCISPLVVNIFASQHFPNMLLALGITTSLILIRFGILYRWKI